MLTTTTKLLLVEHAAKTWTPVFRQETATVGVRRDFRRFLQALVILSALGISATDVQAAVSSVSLWSPITNVQLIAGGCGQHYYRTPSGHCARYSNPHERTCPEGMRVARGPRGHRCTFM